MCQTSRQMNEAYESKLSLQSTKYNFKKIKEKLRTKFSETEIQMRD